TLRYDSTTCIQLDDMFLAHSFDTNNGVRQPGKFGSAPQAGEYIARDNANTYTPVFPSAFQPLHSNITYQQPSNFIEPIDDSTEHMNISSGTQNYSDFPFHQTGQLVPFRAEVPLKTVQSMVVQVSNPLKKRYHLNLYLLTLFRTRKDVKPRVEGPNRF